MCVRYKYILFKNPQLILFIILLDLHKYFALK